MEKISPLMIGMAVWWALAFVTILLPLPDFDAHFFMGAFFMLVLGVIGCLFLLPARVELSVPRSPFLVMFGAFWLVGFNSFVFSEVPFISFIFFCFLSVLPFSFLFSFMQRDREAYFRVVYVGALVVFAGLCVSSFVQYFFFPKLLYHGLVHYPAANPNSLAGMLSLGFFAFYGAMIGGKVPWQRWVGAVFAGLCFVAILSTGSRGATLSLLLALAVFIGFGWRLVRPHLSGHAVVALIGAIGFWVVSYFEPSDVYTQTPMRVLSETLSGDISVLSDRLQIWAAAFDIVRDHFWNGTGIGLFFLYYPEVRTEAGTAGMMAHNDPLHFWAEMGVLAPVLFYTLVVFVVFKTMQVRKVLGDDRVGWLKVLLPFCALGATAIHTHISFHFYILPMLFLMGTGFAFWLHRVERALPSKGFVVSRGRRFETGVFQVLIVVLLLCQLYVFGRFQGSEIMVRHAKEHVKSGGPDGMQRFVNLVNRAGPLSFGLNARALAFAGTVPSGILQARKELTDAEKMQLIDQAWPLFDKAIGHNPRLASLYFELSNLSEIAKRDFPERYKDMPDALGLMRTSFRLQPQHANTRLRFATLLEQAGARDEAYDILKDGLEWNYNAQEPMIYMQTLAKRAAERGDFALQEKALKMSAAHVLHKRALRKNYREQGILYSKPTVE